MMDNPIDYEGRPIEYEGRYAGISKAMIAFGLFAVFMGLLDPGGATEPQRAGLTTEQMQLVRADNAAGFPAPPLPDNPPRGPGA